MRTFLFLSLLALAGSVQAQQRAATITSVAPTFGPPGTTVAIRGAGLAGSEAGSTWAKEVANEPPPGIVDFNGVPGDVLFWQDDLITVKVPKGAAGGPVRVILAGSSVLATDEFDVYYSSIQDRPARSREQTAEALRSLERRNQDRERRPGFEENASPPLAPYYANPWFSGLPPGERTFWAEQGFGNGFFFGNPFSLGRQRSLFFGRDQFRIDPFGFQRPFFGRSLFRGSHRAGFGPFWFRFR